MPSRGALLSIAIVVCFGEMTVTEKGCSVLKHGSELERQFRRHYRDSEVQFKCGAPRLRAVSTEDIVEENGFVECLNDYKVEPSWTMLYRCEYSGCCANNMQCVSDKEDEKVPIVFRIRPRSYKTKQRHPMFIKLMAKNDSSCICDDIITK
ncbi:unnamed protein product [Acanthoscelides obtectus]|uniref:Platelet-derived growth factor (PDGF) family profile domain-containing protein n=1 Tax=Acanthoscelides obtectus TaxID=200917 RepID=A0A9P0LCB6_ACAOB|nr:unnamed protein product [Acanthoscelides obtectus]CAK1664942.1 hypothetical protein AOBTE_LOCUS24566 [Acanthoscelides obtectus]